MHGASDNHTHESQLSEAHLKALHDRGLIDTTIHAAGLWSASAEQVAQLLRFDPRSGGLVIPYHHPFTGQVVLNRVRSDTHPIKTGKAAS